MAKKRPSAIVNSAVLATATTAHRTARERDALLLLHVRSVTLPDELMQLGEVIYVGVGCGPVRQDRLRSERLQSAGPAVRLQRLNISARKIEVCEMKMRPRSRS